MKGSMIRFHYAPARERTALACSANAGDVEPIAITDVEPEGIAVSGTDRGTERRRLLAAVRDDSDTARDYDVDDAALQREPSPTPDGGTVTIAGPLFHCVACDRTYLEPPASCDGCGST